MSDWQPGDPLYVEPAQIGPVNVEPGPEPTGRARHGGGRPMKWEARRAVPGPWPWLQPGTPPVRLEVAA